MNSLQTSASRIRPRAGGFAGSVCPTNLLLLKAALLDGDAAVTAYKAWRPTLNLATISQGEQHLLPLLHRNLMLLGVCDPEAYRFRGVRRYFWVQNLKRMIFAREVFEALTQAGVPFIVLKGAAIAACYLDDLSLRPMFDVDILVREERLADATAVLVEKRLLPNGMSPQQFVDNDRLRSSAPGWPFVARDHVIDLHWKALHLDRRKQADDQFWQASREASLDGTPIRVLDPADQLLHICAHAAQSGGTQAVSRWPADAALVIRGNLGLSFERLVAESVRHRVSAVMAYCLELLANEFDLPIPPTAISKLKGAASWSERAEMRLLVSRHYPRPSARAQIFLEFQDFRRGIRNEIDQPVARAFGSFLQSKMGVAGIGASLLVAIQKVLENPGWLRRLLGRDRYRTVPDPARLPQVGDELNLAGSTIDETPLISGWSTPEATGRWTVGHEATIAWSVKGHQEDLQLFVDGSAMVQKKAPSQRVEVWLNDRQIAHWEFHINKLGPLPALISVPAELIRSRDVLMLTFVIRAPCSPAELGVSTDTRALGIHLRSISLNKPA